MPNHVPLVVALEPDVRQATILKRVIRDHVHADLIVVDSRDATISAVNDRLPDVILLTALLSPRDEAEIIAHLRTLSGAEHLQTHTIPHPIVDGHEHQHHRTEDGDRRDSLSKSQFHRRGSFPGLLEVLVSNTTVVLVGEAIGMPAANAKRQPCNW